MEESDYFQATLKFGAVTVELERQNFPIDNDLEDILKTIAKRIEFALKRCFDTAYDVTIKKAKKEAA